MDNIKGSAVSCCCDIKIVHFGLSNRFTKGEKILKAVGTIYKAALEFTGGGECIVDGYLGRGGGGVYNFESILPFFTRD